MRSFFTSFFLLICRDGGFHSCGGGVELPANPSQPASNSPPRPERPNHIEGSGDMTNFVAFEASYVTTDGSIATEQISSPPWKKSATTAGINTYRAKLDGYELTVADG